MEDQNVILEEATLNQIRNIINQNKIKLWQYPYYDKETGPNESKILQCANNLATTLELEDLEIYQGLKKLQQNALEKLNSRETLTQFGQIGEL